MSDQQHGSHGEHSHTRGQGLGHDHHFEDGQPRATHILHYEDSPDSSNGFVKIEKPHDFSGGYPSYGSQQQRVEITPSDDVAPPTREDFKMDYAPSPQQFAAELASNTPESLEQFLAATQRTAEVANKGSRFERDLVGQFSPVEEEPSSEGHPVMYEEEEEDEDEEEPSAEKLQKATEEVMKRIEDVQAKIGEEPEETMYQRHGPLTLGKPASISSLSPQHHGGLTDIVHDIAGKVSDVAYMAGTKISDAAHVVGSKIQDATGIGEESLFKEEHHRDIKKAEDSLDNLAAKVDDKSYHLTEKAIDAGGKAYEGTKDFGSKVYEGTKDIGGKVYEGTKDIGGKVYEGTIDMGSKVYEGTKDIGSKVYEGTKDIGGKVIEGTKDVGGRVVEGTKEAGGLVMDSATLAKDALSEVATNISSPTTTTAGLRSDVFGDFTSPEKDPILLHDFGSPQTVGKPPLHMKSPEKSTSCCFTNMQSMDPRMSDLLHWRDPRKSGIVFGVTLAYLICLAVFPVISVVAYTGLIVILGTLSFRLYKMIMAFVQKTEQENPFKPYLEKSLQVPQEKIHTGVDNISHHFQNLLVQLRRLFLVENVADTIKFAVLLWALTYVGACLSVMALVIIAFVGLFTLPKFYETYKTQIDHYYNIVHSKAKQACDTVQEKVPQLKKKAHPE